MELFYKTDDWKVDEMSPDELLEAHDAISQQIDRLLSHWTDLNRSQTKIMQRYHELEAEHEGDYNTCDKCGTIVIAWGAAICDECKTALALAKQK